MHARSKEIHVQASGGLTDPQRLCVCVCVCVCVYVCVRVCVLGEDQASARVGVSLSLTVDLRAC